MEKIQIYKKFFLKFKKKLQIWEWRQTHITSSHGRQRQEDHSSGLALAT
jgi:hypothetical protein